MTTPAGPWAASDGQAWTRGVLHGWTGAGWAHARAWDGTSWQPGGTQPAPVLVPDVIAFRAAAGSVQGTEDTVPIPNTVQAGDLVICTGTVASAAGTPAVVGVNVTGSGGTVTPVLLSSNPVPGDPSRTCVWAWTAPGPGGAATLTADVSVDWPGISVAAYSGAAVPASADIVFASSGGQAVTSFTAPVITVTETGSWAVHVGGQCGPGGNWIASGPGTPRAVDSYRFMAAINDSNAIVSGVVGGGTWQLGTTGGAQPNYAWASTLRLAPRMIPGNGSPPAPAAQPFPAVLQGQGYTLTDEWGPGDLTAWRYLPGGSTNVTFGNANGASGQVNSTRYVSVEDDYLKLESRDITSAGCIQSPFLLPTDNGVLEVMIRFSGVTYDGQDRLPGWCSWWMYGNGWPAGGELDVVETMFGISWVGYHWGTDPVNHWDASTNPWAMSGTWTGSAPNPPPGKVVQLAPMGPGGQPRPGGNTDNWPVAPNFAPDAWTHVTVCFDGSPPSRRIRVWYEGILYTTVQGDFVVGAPMYICAGTGYGNFSGGLGQDARLEVPNSIEIRWVRHFT